MASGSGIISDEIHSPTVLALSAVIFGLLVALGVGVALFALHQERLRKANKGIAKWVEYLVFGLAGVGALILVILFAVVWMVWPGPQQGRAIAAHMKEQEFKKVAEQELSTINA
jgi:hypothetical protein